MLKLKTLLQSKIFYLILLSITFLYVFINVKIIENKSIYNGDETTFVGQIIKIKETNYGYSFTLKSKENLVCYFKENLNYDLGDYVIIDGTLTTPSNNTLPNTFNYKEYLSYNKIFYTVDVNNINLLKKNSNIIYKLKNNLMTYLNRFESQIYLKSFILGDTSYLDNDIYNSYLENGINHLLAIGSTHITLLSMFLLFVFKKLKLKEGLSYFLIFIIIFLYIILTDFPVSIIRSYLFFIAVYFNKKLHLKIKAINLFIIVLVITLLSNPFYIYNKAFLYSYSISFILIINSDNLKGNYFLTLFKVSMIAFLYSIPLNIYFNYSINLLSIIYNLFFVPFINIIIFPFALLTVCLPFLDHLYYLLTTLMENISLFLNRWTIGIIILKKITIPILIMYFLLITYIIKGLVNSNKRRIIILLIILVIHSNINHIIKSNYMIMIDVKQGDSILMHSNGKSILIDTGGLYNQLVSDNTMVMLKSFGIKKLDFLFLTHGDFDHMGDSLNLINNFRVDNVIFNANEFNDLEQKVIKKLEEIKINYSIGYQDMTYNIGSIHIKLLNGEYSDENDASLVMHILFKNKNILLMGDASKKTEKDILNRYMLEKIDYLKVGHHGSKTSTGEDFLKIIKPEYALISVAKNNLYKHPSLEVIERLEKYQVKIYQTSLDGSILINMDNEGTFTTFAP